MANYLVSKRQCTNSFIRHAIMPEVRRNGFSIHVNNKIRKCFKWGKAHCGFFWKQAFFQSGLATFINFSLAVLPLELTVPTPLDDESCSACNKLLPFLYPLEELDKKSTNQSYTYKRWCLLLTHPLFQLVFHGIIMEESCKLTENNSHV